MIEKYNDGSNHKICNNCGFCIDCGDCKEFGCGNQIWHEVVNENLRGKKDG